jgi:radical SAM protein with 4Fe4S-binding SPASM domain
VPYLREICNLNASFLSSIPLQKFSLWEKMKVRHAPVSFSLEVTARCNNNCTHCYINLPAGDKTAKEKELAFEDLKEIVDEAVSLGALWCLVTGGEPFLRQDLVDIYLYLKKKGLLVSVFTNAVLITEEHVRIFKKYPPRDIEVSVYGVTEKTYEKVTRRPGSFSAFIRGLDLLLRSGVKVRLKAMALRSNLHEFQDIARFCREKTKDYFRFDPFLHLRFDGNPTRNEEIKSERLTPAEIVSLERSDPERLLALEKRCDNLIVAGYSQTSGTALFSCGTGNGSFAVSYDGHFRLCSSLWHPDCIYGLKKGSLSNALEKFVPKVRQTRSDSKGFLEQCRVCPLINLCMWCPAHAYLETGEMDRPVPYFCQTAHARAHAIGGQ